MLNIGIDIGGTFTDSVAIADNGGTLGTVAFVGKASTTPHSFAEGVINSLEDLAAGMGLSLEEMLAQTRFVGHGTTVGTNALINRSGSRIGLITTRGFEDTVFIQRGVGKMSGLSEEQLKHRVVVRPPVPLVDRDCIAGVTERVDCFGQVVFPLGEDEVRAAASDLLQKGVESIGVCLLWSFVNDAHEQMVGRIVRELSPHIPLTLSCELVPRMKENARTNAVMINAYVDKTMNLYLTDLSGRLQERGFAHELAIMQAFGGVTSRSLTKSIHTIDSGPVGGTIASKFIGELLGHRNVITTDVGGTSFDVSLIHDGQEQLAREYFGAPGVIARFETLAPRLDVQSIGAGGGTIAWVDQISHTIKVGPNSAGADPGPVFYGRGGTRPTVADACMALGYLNPEYFLGGRLKTHKEKSLEAIELELARPLGMSAQEAAAAVFDIVNNHMSDAIRGHVVEKGYDPADFVAFAFGGGGPLHAASYSQLAGVKKTIILDLATAFSAFGISISDIVHRQSLSRIIPDPFDWQLVDRNFAQLERRVRGEFESEGLEVREVQFRYSFEMRFRGQVHELTVYVPQGLWLRAKDPGTEIKRLFEARYEEVYGKGSAYSASGVEIVGQNVEGIGKTSKPSFSLEEERPADPEGACKGTRQAYFSALGAAVSTKLYDWEKLGHGNVVQGPAIIESVRTTVLVPPGQLARVDGYRNIIFEH